ncbi:unnamed protein product [Vitrella brassicaformis CCMP3155]|uniref:Uncharacterized protein n=1 Tax=Vitrella brassicaformis (strain CCMP3155) TaxID=1169540 RepID=A0A0G4GLI2_VITBC|nr:unnamed protein product [Vitrella brassicaformis CCMP3155]|eukprot:CEM30974.1 unnamed protein product [Vitrella brassicaformis CCMP3155]
MSGDEEEVRLRPTATPAAAAAQSAGEPPDEGLEAPLLPAGSRRSEQRQSGIGERASAAARGFWQRLAEQLVQSCTFGASRRAKKAEFCARVMLVGHHSWGYHHACRLLSAKRPARPRDPFGESALAHGQHHIADKAEERPGWRHNHHPLTGGQGIEREARKAGVCVGGATCICVDLWQGYFPPKSGSSRSLKYVLTFNEEGQISNDNVELRTNLQPAGPLPGLKVGLYDSKMNKTEQSPSWFFANVGRYVIGGIQLRKVKVTDIELWKGLTSGSLKWSDYITPYKEYHTYDFRFSQLINQNDTAADADYTRVHIEYANFMVQEMFSPRGSFSLVALAVLVVGCISLLNNLNLFNVFFPLDQGKQERRQVSPVLKVLSCGALAEEQNTNTNTDSGGASASAAVAGAAEGAGEGRGDTPATRTGDIA